MTAISIFPPSTTAIPITMDDKVAFLIERPGHAPEVLLKTHREICDGTEEWRDCEFDPSEIQEHCEIYCYDVLEPLYAGLNPERTEFWTTRSDAAHAVKMYSESDDWADNQKAEVLRAVPRIFEDHYWMSIDTDFQEAAEWTTATGKSTARSQRSQEKISRF